MKEPFAERLSILDATFLACEDENVHMHVASLSTFDARPLTNEDGTLDFERIEKAMQQMLYRNPRMRQKVWWPVAGPPVWVDDLDFRLSYHLRQTALPLPGDARQLKRLAGRVMSQTLDLSKPLWEIWIVEGVEGGERFAVLAKLHHCLADGIGARDILTSYLGLAPSREPEVVDSWRPRPAPSLAKLALSSITPRTQAPRELREAARQLFVSPRLGDSLRNVAGSATQVISNVLSPVSNTPLNHPIGPHRRFDFTRCDFDAVRAIRKASGGKVNDVVLSCVAGALRSFLLARKLQVDELDFRVMVPVNVRDEREGHLGNRVSQMTVPIPLFESDPQRRLKRIIATTARVKASQQSQIGELAVQLADWAGLFLPRPLARRAARQVASNLVVTNIPGPLVPMYLLDGRMLDSYPMVPLSPNQALGIALYTYDRSLHWGLNADSDLVPDLHEFRAAIDTEFAQLCDAFTPIEARLEARPVQKETQPRDAVAQERPRAPLRQPPAPEVVAAAEEPPEPEVVAAAAARSVASAEPLSASEAASRELGDAGQERAADSSARSKKASRAKRTTTRRKSKPRTQPEA